MIARGDAAMVDPSSKRSPPALAEPAPLAQIDLRGDPGDSRFLAGARSALGFALPVDPNTTAAANGVAALWLGPDEWLVVGGAGSERRLAEGLGAALAGLHVSIVDVSASRIALELGGSKARLALAKGCGLDLDPRAFGLGRVAQTLLARFPVILEPTGGEPAYRLFVRRSFAPDLVRWLEDSLDAGDLSGDLT